MSQKMKLSIVTVTLTFLAALYFFPKSQSYAAGEKIAFVDIAKVFDNFQKTKDQDTVLQETGKKKESERDAIVQDIRKLKDELTLLADDAKLKKQEAIDGKVRELQDFDRNAKDELGKIRNTVVRDIFKEIDDVVQRYGERKGFDVILNERALLYRNPRFDVTQDVLTELNQTYAKGKK